MRTTLQLGDQGGVVRKVSVSVGGYEGVGGERRV